MGQLTSHKVGELVNLHKWIVLDKHLPNAVAGRHYNTEAGKDYNCSRFAAGALQRRLHAAESGREHIGSNTLPCACWVLRVADDRCGGVHLVQCNQDIAPERSHLWCRKVHSYDHSAVGGRCSRCTVRRLSSDQLVQRLEPDRSLNVEVLDYFTACWGGSRRSVCGCGGAGGRGGAMGIHDRTEVRL